MTGVKEFPAPSCSNQLKIRAAIKHQYYHNWGGRFVSA